MYVWHAQQDKATKHAVVSKRKSSKKRVSTVVNCGVRMGQRERGEKKRRRESQSQAGNAVSWLS